MDFYTPASAATTTGPNVRTLDSAECQQLLSTTSVGRVGYVTAQGLQILPLNYRTSDGTIMFRTTPGSSLSQLATMGASVTLEVDEHDSTELVWSVVVHGTLSKADRRLHPDTVATPADAWPGAQFTQALLFSPTSWSGRVIERPAEV